MVSDPSKCPFCSMGQEKRLMIYRATSEMSRKELRELIEVNHRRERMNKIKVINA